MNSETDTQLHGRKLILARMLWLAIFILTLVVFCANLLVGSYGLLATILLVAVTSVWFAVSLVLFWRKSSDQAILLFSLLLVLTGGILIPPLPVALVNYGVWWVPIWVLYVLAAVMLSFGYTIPDGRFIPGFTRWLALGWIAVSLVPIPIFGAANHLSNWWLSPPYTLIRIAFYCSLALALLYRYRRRSTPIQRQQIKWVVFAAIIVVGAVSVANLVLHVLPSLFPVLVLSTLPNQLAQHWCFTFCLSSFRSRLGSPCCAIAYGTSTPDQPHLGIRHADGLPGTGLFGLVIGLGSLVRLFTGQVSQSPVVIVASTVIIYALFHPLRHRIQAIIDRRFYRRKYDAARTVEAFSSTLRNEVDLNQLREQLLAVVQETMQPAHVSLWLRKPEREVKHE